MPILSSHRRQCGTISLAVWSDVAYGHQSLGGRCRLGHVLGFLPSTPSVPYHILQWKLVKSRLGGEVYAFREMVDHISLYRELNASCADLLSGAPGVEDCETISNHLRAKKTSEEERLVRQFQRIEQPLEHGVSGNAYWPPGFEKPADGLTTGKSDMIPHFRLSEPGAFNPGILRPMRGTSSIKEGRMQFSSALHSCFSAAYCSYLRVRSN